MGEVVAEALGEQRRSAIAEGFESISRFFRRIRNAKDSAIFGEGTKGVLSQKGRTEDKGWCDVLQVTGAIRGSRFIRAVAQQRPAGWLTSEGNCGSYLLGQAGKDVRAGYGEQWIKALESGDRYHAQPA
ncbi:MAG TPA: hypothetical protein VGG69_04090 [Rhizomicrobium sp.]|jgi:hypothetical protein